MSTNYCGCTNKEIIVAQTIGKFLHKQLRCKDCGRMFIEDEDIFNFDEIRKNRENNLKRSR